MGRCLLFYADNVGLVQKVFQCLCKVRLSVIVWTAAGRLLGSMLYQERMRSSVRIWRLGMPVVRRKQGRISSVGLCGICRTMEIICQIISKCIAYPFEQAFRLSRADGYPFCHSVGLRFHLKLVSFHQNSELISHADLFLNV